MNNILLFSDNHFCSTSSILRKRGAKYTLRLENGLKTIEWLVDIAKENNCQHVFCLGDFFNSSTLDAQELSALSEIDFKDLTVHFLVGNHEIQNASRSYNSSQTFLIDKSCVVYSEPAIIGIGKTLIYLLPYQLELNRKNSVMEYFPNLDMPEGIEYKFLFSHNDIKGIQMGQFISQEGFEIDDLQKNFNLVVNGHIHNGSEITNNVINIGNITGLNFSEDALKYKHHAILLDCDTGKYEYKNNPYALNFSKVDFTQNNSIDYINETSFNLGNNAIVSIKVKEEDYDYINKRFNPEVPEDKLVPKNCNILAAKIIVQNTLSKQLIDNNQTKELQLNHLEEFQKYILQTLESSDVLLSELQKVIE